MGQFLLETRAFLAAWQQQQQVHPDLLIRTGGEHRISNFMLWQLAYTELYFTDILWPDFSPEAFDAALTDFAHRQRRFGGVPEAKSRAAA